MRWPWRGRLLSSAGDFRTLSLLLHHPVLRPFGIPLRAGRNPRNHYAFTLAGLPPELAFAALLASLFGSYINIPVTRLHGGALHPETLVTSYGVRYRVPYRRWDGSTTLAVNVGGAVVPVLITIYLLVHQPEIMGRAMLATLIVALVVNRAAKPIAGIGIATPMFIPPIVAALAGYVLGGTMHAAPVAYIGGVLGTLIGADIMNLGRLTDLGAPVASIGRGHL
jgi:uncharacterized membrane protein